MWGKLFHRFELAVKAEPWEPKTNPTRQLWRNGRLRVNLRYTAIGHILRLSGPRIERYSKMVNKYLLWIEKTAPGGYLSERAPESKPGISRVLRHHNKYNVTLRRSIRKVTSKPPFCRRRQLWWKGCLRVPKLSILQVSWKKQIAFPYLLCSAAERALGSYFSDEAP